MAEFELLSDDELAGVVGGFDWALFGQNMLQRGCSSIPELAELTQAILAKNWDKVKVEARRPTIAAIPIVAECFAIS